MQNRTPLSGANPTPVGTPNVTTGTSQGSVVEPAQAPAQQFGPGAPGTLPLNAAPVASTPSTAISVRPAMERNIVETIILVVVSIIAVVFIGLFIWKYFEWDAAKTDVDGQIDRAVAEAISENTTALENEFAEREKCPYDNFMGPIDYGSVSFEYPKTWSVYVARDAANGGDFEAYFNPGEVQPVSSTSINALRMTIRNTAFDNVVRTYDSLVASGRLEMQIRSVGGTTANVYRGEISGNIYGIVAAFKLRDKTVLIQTDAMIFEEDYYKLLDTITFVE